MQANSAWETFLTVCMRVEPDFRGRVRVLKAEKISYFRKKKEEQKDTNK